MSVINKVTKFSNGEQLTADKLNDLVDLATFDQSATDSASTTVNTSGQIVVADSGVSTAKIAAGAVTTAKIAADAVTTAKIADANVTFAKLTDVIDDDTMATASATTLATSESIKAYADSLADITPQSSDNYDQHSIADSGSVNIGGLILKFGNFELASDSEITLTFPTAFPTACLMVMTQDTRGSGGGSYTSKGIDVPIKSKSTAGFTVNRYDEMNNTVGLTFLAIGY